MTDLTYMIEINGKKYLVTEKNQLADMQSWDSDICAWMAEKANLKLQDEHRTALEFIRETYRNRDRHPIVRVVAAHLAKKHGAEKGTLRFFYSLFPKGIQQAVILAGVPLQGLCY